ncbi:Uncharacterized protein APZ42_005038 [Daphnia magna]|uniref:Uncharacterized protein n=1 Tax=Daphnia magna TaxID=35525 RepID=A0A164GPP5_9CRUS|nr:Uncharacterized protein APZ42_005038 [Daphnia magna]
MTTSSSSYCKKRSSFHSRVKSKKKICFSFKVLSLFARSLSKLFCGEILLYAMAKCFCELEKNKKERR